MVRVLSNRELPTNVLTGQKHDQGIEEDEPYINGIEAMTGD